jgi:hypothetical protein
MFFFFFLIQSSNETAHKNLELKINSNAEDKTVSVNMPVFRRLHFVFILVGSYLTRSHFNLGKILFTFSSIALLNTTNHLERFFLLCWFGNSICWVLPLTGGRLTEIHLTFSVDRKFLIIWAFDRILFGRLTEFIFRL